MKNIKLLFLIIPILQSLYGQKGSSPNFIFILADDQGWNGTSVKMMEREPLSQSDYYQTPKLKKRALGLLFVFTPIVPSNWILSEKR